MIANYLQLGPVAGADEPLTLSMSDIIYSGYNSDPSVTARLSLTKTTTTISNQDARPIFLRVVHRRFCSLDRE